VRSRCRSRLTLLGGVLAAYEGISVEEFEAKSDAFLRTAQHPTLGRGYLETAYVPMVELLGYLARSRTKPKPTTSMTARRNQSGSGAAPAAGRCWLLATRTAISRCSTSPSIRTSRLRLLVLHDDGQREFDYTGGAEQALERADKSGWTIVSMKTDWATIF
jgi:hypothetical protein